MYKSYYFSESIFSNFHNSLPLLSSYLLVSAVLFLNFFSIRLDTMKTTYSYLMYHSISKVKFHLR